MWVSKHVLVGSNNWGGICKNATRKLLGYEWRLKCVGRRVKTVRCTTRLCRGKDSIAMGSSNNRE